MLKYKIPQIVTLTRFFPCLYYLYLFDEDIYLPTKVHNFTEKYVSKIDK